MFLAFMVRIMIRIFVPNLPWILELIETLFFVIFLIYYFKGNYLITTSDGLEYHRRDFMISTNWDDIDRIETLHKGYGKGESLLLRQATLTQKSKNIIWLIHPEYVARIIPLSAFSQPWRQSQLGKEIQKHAPHIF